jgi:hypothetical protein
MGINLRASRCGYCLRIAVVNEVPAAGWFPATATLLSTVDCPRLVRRRTTKCQHRPTVRRVIRPAPCPLSLTVNDSQSRVGGSGSTSPARSSSGANGASVLALAVEHLEPSSHLGLRPTPQGPQPLRVKVHNCLQWMVESAVCPQNVRELSTAANRTEREKRRSGGPCMRSAAQMRHRPRR